MSDILEIPGLRPAHAKPRLALNATPFDTKIATNDKGARPPRLPSYARWPWLGVRSYLERLDEVPEDLDETQATIQEFADFDPNGTAFKYPVSRDGTRHLEDTTHINVEVFGERMVHLKKALDSYCDWADALYDMWLDMEADRRSCCD